MNCYKPNKNNPMGNFLPFDPRDKKQVCTVSMNEHFKYLNVDNTDHAFRLNFNPNAVTTSYPDISGLAKFLFKDPARCRDTGYLCVTNAGETRNLDRIGFSPNETYYQEINSKVTTGFNIGGHTN